MSKTDNGKVALSQGCQRAFGLGQVIIHNTVIEEGHVATGVTRHEHPALLRPIVSDVAGTVARGVNDLEAAGKGQEVTILDFIVNGCSGIVGRGIPDKDPD